MTNDTSLSAHPYDRLTPDVIIAAVESLGRLCDRRIQPLNSWRVRMFNFFNRVWAIGKNTYIRLYPNPGFRLIIKNKEYRWNKFYGWRKGKVQ